MDFAAAISQLSIQHQAAFSALNCEKMLPSVIKFDEQEVMQASSLYEKAINAIYDFSLGQPVAVDYAALKDEIESYWPDLDETGNDFASYAFDAFVAISEALNLVLSGETAHATSCSAAVLDTVDMYVQETSETEPPAAELEAFIQVSPFMIREVNRQATLLEEVGKAFIMNQTNLTYLKKLNEQEQLIDFAALPY